MIDLHLHTTASDGRLSPSELVRRVAEAGITVMSVTDHDTVAGLADVRTSATRVGVQLVDGIEITAVHDGRDVHILGYFIDTADPDLAHFLRAQRDRRVDRVREIGERLASLGVAVDVDALLLATARNPGTSIGRPTIARALIAAGQVTTTQDAFDRFLAVGQPAFVPRVGPTPLEVVQVIHAARGIASMAHPAVTNQPTVMAALIENGLDAIEVYHSDHSDDTRRALEVLAARHELLITGGSDFHGDDSRDRPLGGVSLSPTDFARLEDAARARRARS